MPLRPVPRRVRLRLPPGARARAAGRKEQTATGQTTQAEVAVSPTTKAFEHLRLAQPAEQASSASEPVTNERTAEQISTKRTGRPTLRARTRPLARKPAESTIARVREAAGEAIVVNPGATVQAAEIKPPAKKRAGATSESIGDAIPASKGPGITMINRHNIGQQRDAGSRRLVR